MGFRTTPQQTTRLYLPYSWIPKMRSVSLAAIRSRNSFNHIFASLRSPLQVGKFHRLLTESFSERRELVLHISIKQLIFKTKCPIHPVFNCTTPSRRGNLHQRARIVHTSKKVTNNHSRTPRTTRRRRPQSTSSPQSSSHQPLLFSSSCAALHLQQCFSSLLQGNF